MAQQVQGQFGYRAIQLRKTDPLGTGAYGAVYKAMCDDLVSSPDPPRPRPVGKLERGKRRRVW